MYLVYVGDVLVGLAVPFKVQNLRKVKNPLHYFSKINSWKNDFWPSLNENVPCFCLK